MIVPNYIPEPLEVPGNVTEERYAVRVAFIRRVTLLHLTGVLAVAGLASVPWIQVGLIPTLVSLALVLIGLDLWRIAKRGSAIEAKVSAAMLPIVLVLAGRSAAEIALAGFPIAAVLAGSICAAIYTALCGRDYSFVGGFLLSLIASTVALAALAPKLGYDVFTTAIAMTANAVLLAYTQYDLASILARRRRGEEVAAVVDLYRDVFNFFGYAVRCVKHWRRHRIFELPRQ